MDGFRIADIIKIKKRGQSAENCLVFYDAPILFDTLESLLDIKALTLLCDSYFIPF